MLHLHHDATFTSQCSIYITVLRLHHSVTFTSQCYIYIAVLHLHHSVTFTSQCYVYITVFHLPIEMSFSYQEFLNKEVLKLKDNLGRSIVHVAAEKGRDNCNEIYLLHLGLYSDFVIF